MKCYLFDETGIYTGEYIAQESPLEPGIYLMPESSTTVKPPTIADNEFVQFENGNWMVKQKQAEPEPTAEELQKALIRHYTDAVQTRLDEKAREKGYDNILSACSYTGYPNFFEEESKRFVKWRADVWVYAKDVLYNVQNNISPLPTIEEFISNMPQYLE